MLNHLNNGGSLQVVSATYVNQFRIDLLILNLYTTLKFKSDKHIYYSILLSTSTANNLSDANTIYVELYISFVD